jgi:hypothetical protein
MSIQNHRSTQSAAGEPNTGDDWVRLPVIVDANRDKAITLRDEREHARSRLVAELVLEAFVGARPQGHVVGFKDDNRLNCHQSNLEWVKATTARTETARAKAVATRKQADAMREKLEGRAQSDSALLVAEDRVR